MITIAARLRKEGECILRFLKDDWKNNEERIIS